MHAAHLASEFSASSQQCECRVFDRFSGECYIDRSAEPSSTPDIAARENHRTDRTLDGSFKDLDNPLVRRSLAPNARRQRGCVIRRETRASSLDNPGRSVRA